MAISKGSYRKTNLYTALPLHVINALGGRIRTINFKFRRLKDSGTVQLLE